jgi:zinc protease
VRKLHPTTLGAALCLLTGVAHADDTKEREVYRTTERHLDNGMTVIVEEDHRLPLVAARIQYDVGEAAVAESAPGAATLTTYLMLLGSEHVADGEYYRRLAAAGATGVSDSTWSAGVAEWATVPSNRLALPLWLWSDQMGFFDKSLDDARVATQRTKLRTQRRTGLEGAPLSRLDQFAAEEVWPAGHPYHTSLLTPEDVDRIDRAGVIAFHDRWLTPRHATLILVGDVTTADAFSLAERYFGSIPGGPSDTHVKVPPDATLAGETQIDVAADVPHARISVHWRTPRLLTLPDAHLDVVAHLLNGARTAWLYWKLVDEAKVATSVIARQRSGAYGSQFVVDVEAAGTHTAAELLTAFDAAMDAARGKVAHQSEIEGAAYEMLIDRVFGLERASTRASDYAKFSTLVGTPDYLGHDLYRYQRIDANTVRGAMETWLPRDRRVVVLVTPTPHVAAGGEKKARRFVPAGSP